MTLLKYPVLKIVLHNRKRYAVGETIVLMSNEAASLIEAGALGEPIELPPPIDPKPETPESKEPETTESDSVTDSEPETPESKEPETTESDSVTDSEPETGSSRKNKGKTKEVKP